MPDTKLTIEPPKPLGRPSSYTDHIAQLICLRISEGESLRTITQDEEMPDRATIYRWLLQRPDFCDQYARAREEQADTLADEILAIADETPEMNPIIDKRTGELIEMQMHSAYVQWQKNRIDARKWTAMKLRPKKYGDMVRQSIEEKQGDVVDVTAKEVLTSIVSNIEMKRQLQNAG
jgi:hypothetical protein